MAVKFIHLFILGIILLRLDSIHVCVGASVEVSSGAGAVSGDIRREAPAGRLAGPESAGEQVQGRRNARHLPLRPGIRQRRPAAQILGEETCLRRYE